MAAPPTTQAQDQQPTSQVQPTPYPLQIRTATALINNIPTTATLHPFTDKLLLTISQNGLLNHWLHVPLLGASPLSDPSTYLTPSDPDADVASDKPDASLLPFPHLTATTVLGGTRDEDAVLGQTLAVTVASAVVVKRADEGRMVVLGLGLEKRDENADAAGERARFEGLVGLCLEVL